MKTKTIGILFLMNSLICSSKAQTSAIEKWYFKSTFDSFEIVRRGSQYFLGKTPVQVKSLDKFLPLFETQIEGPCPKKLGKLDLTAILQRAGKKIERKFYFSTRQVYVDEKCGDLSGEGVYSLPLDRSWFIGDTKGQIDVGSDFEITIDKAPFASFVKQDGNWQNTNSAFFTNWDIFDEFLRSLNQHEISQRFHLRVGEGRPHFQLSTNGKKYQFLQITDGLWAVKRPELKWLLASPDFGFLRDMSPDLWRDRHADGLAIIKDGTQSPDVRIEAIKKMGVYWSQSMKLVLHSILLNYEEDPRLKIEIVRTMRRKPSLENLGVLIQLMSTTQDKELLQDITGVLRLRNPAGPSVKAKDSEEKIERKRREWQKWWKKMEPQASQE